MSVILPVIELNEIQNGDTPRQEVTTERAKRKPLIPIRFLIGLLCSSSLIMAFITRSNLNTAIVGMVQTQHNGTSAPDLNGGEFSWSANTQGILLGSFYYGYLPMQFVTGRTAELFGTKWLVAGSMGISLAINGLTPLMARTNVELLIVSRVVLGAAQSTTWTIYSLGTNWVPHQERGIFYAACSVGANAGCMISTSLTGYLVDYGFSGGWPSAFYVSALLTAAWLVLWICFVKDTPEEHHLISQAELDYILENNEKESTQQSPRSAPWKDLLTSVPLWCWVAAKVAGQWCNGILYLKLPAYLTDILGFSLTVNGLIDSVFILATCSDVLFQGFCPIT